MTLPSQLPYGTTPTAQPVPSHPAAAGGVAGTAAYTDELVVMHILRLLNRAGLPRPLAPVERALVAGARAAFDQLLKVCDDLLARPSTNPADTLAPPTDTVAGVAAPVGGTSAPTHPAGAPAAGRRRRRQPPRPVDEVT
jgi:hypothetical protein